MKTFILLATLYHSNGAPADSFVLDYNLSGHECMDLLLEFEPLMNAQTFLSCEQTDQ